MSLSAEIEPVPSPPGLRAAWTACRAGLAGAARLALDIVLPTLCVACREPVHGEGVCAACWAKLSFIAPPFCERLGIPFVYDPGPGILSMEAIADPPAYQRARAAVRFDEVARTLVHGLKYHDRTDLAPTLGRWMARAGAELLADADLVMPVPLHWRRGWAAATTSRARSRTSSRGNPAPVGWRRFEADPADPAAGGTDRTERATQCSGGVPGRP